MMPVFKSLTINIDRLRVRARHGVGVQELTVGNEFEVSVMLSCPAAIKAAETDNVIDTVNYADVVDVITDAMDIPSDLLEHVAARIAADIKRHFPLVESGRVTVTKPAPPISAELAGVAVTLEF